MVPPPLPKSSFLSLIFNKKKEPQDPFSVRFQTSEYPLTMRTFQARKLKNSKKPDFSGLLYGINRLVTRLRPCIDSKRRVTESFVLQFQRRHLPGESSYVRFKYSSSSFHEIAPTSDGETQVKRCSPTNLLERHPNHSPIVSGNREGSTENSEFPLKIVFFSKLEKIYTPTIAVTGMVGSTAELPADEGATPASQSSGCSPRVSEISTHSAARQSDTRNIGISSRKIKRLLKIQYNNSG